MQSFIGVKQIQAEPMTRGAYNELRGWTVPADENPADAGYLVVYPDGYRSWSPADQFERYYLPLADATKITAAEVERMMDGPVGTRHTLGSKTTVLHLVNAIGFEMVESSSCVDPANYDEDLGASICRKRMKDRHFGLLGFVLQWARHGIQR